jgi:formylglycine-generating enzyme required for sulfatase activity
MVARVPAELGHGVLRGGVPKTAAGACMTVLDEGNANEPGLPVALGPYRIQSKIGQGGMGTVYKAVHETLERPAAIKMLPRELSADPEYVSRFLREARVIATLRHEHVVQVYDAGAVGDRYYIAMEFVEGASLGAFLEEKHLLPESEGLALMQQAAKGLAAAHAMGLVHRDIKPDNLLLSKDRKTLRIVDFGLVRESASETRLTVTGAQMGTPQFMSPEQSDGEQADARADLYSLGATFFKVFTGRVPFEATSVLNQLFKHKFEAPPDPCSLNPELSRNVRNLLLTLLAKRREDRPRSAEAVVDLIEDIKAGKEIPEPPAFKSPIPTEAQTFTDGDHSPNVLAASSGTAKSEAGDGESGPRAVRKGPKWAVLAGGLAGLGLLVFVVSLLFRGGNGAAPEVRRNAVGLPGPQQKTLSLDLGSGVRMELVLIPAGSFRMGSPASELERDGGEVQHLVRISRPFYMGTFEVMQAQYEAVMGVEQNRSEWRGAGNPVENVNWHDAMEFCRLLSEKTKRIARLPYEAEWEYACRAGTETPFYFGDVITSARANFDGETRYGKSPASEDRGRTVPVGQFPSNNWGLYDMHGNVWEWCLDWSGPYPEGEATDPKGPRTGERRVQRGGSFSSSAWHCRAAYRDLDKPGDRESKYGFRIVIECE